MIYWFSSSRTREKNLGNMMKNIHKECGLDAENIMNKSGRTTTVIRMVMSGVPAAVGAKITGHKTLDAYQRYDRSIEAHVMAAQKCIADGASFADHLNVETHRFKEMVVNGVPASELLPKKDMKMKGKGVNGGDVRMEGIYIDSDEESTVEAIINEAPILKMEADMKQEQGAGALKRKSVEFEDEEKKCLMKPPKCVKRDGMGADDLRSALKEWDTWADQFDWKTFEGKVLEERSVKINPVTTVFGRVENMKNCNVTINIQSISSG